MRADEAALAQRPTKQAEVALLAVWGCDDLIALIGQCACDPLRPEAAGYLGVCCRSLYWVMRPKLATLRPLHGEARLLAARMRISCWALRELHELTWSSEDDPGLSLTANELRTLGKLIGSGVWPLQRLHLYRNNIGDEGARALCMGLARGAAPQLTSLVLMNSKIGPGGAAALGAALERDALPNLRWLCLSHNPLGDAGMVALAAPLRRLPALESLGLSVSSIGDEGVAALVGGLGEGELKALEILCLDCNPVTDVGCTGLAAAVESRALPALSNLGSILRRESIFLASDVAYQKLEMAVRANIARHGNGMPVVARVGFWIK